MDSPKVSLFPATPSSLLKELVPPRFCLTRFRRYLLMRVLHRPSLSGFFLFFFLRTTGSPRFMFPNLPDMTPSPFCPPRPAMTSGPTFPLKQVFKIQALHLPSPSPASNRMSKRRASLFFPSPDSSAECRSLFFPALEILLPFFPSHSFPKVIVDGIEDVFELPSSMTGFAIGQKPTPCPLSYHFFPPCLSM